MAYLEEKNTFRFIPQKYTEQDILYLHETLLTTGFHVIEVPSFEFGRTLMRTFLDSLNFYTNIACLSNQVMIGSGLVNIYSSVYQQSEEGLNQYLIEHYDFDFLWIEESNEWRSKTWYLEFENSLQEQHIDKFAPIIILKERS